MLGNRDVRTTFPGVATSVILFGALLFPAPTARAACCQWTVVVKEDQASYKTCEDGTTQQACEDDHAGMDPEFDANESCHPRLKFCLPQGGEGEGASAAWSHGEGSDQVCDAEGVLAASLVLAGNACSEDLCQSTSPVPIGSSPLDVAALARSELQSTCFQAFEVGGSGSGVVVRVDDASIDVCVNGERIVGPETLDSVAVCSTGSGDQTAAGLAYLAGGLPSLSGRQGTLLGALLLGVAAASGMRRARRRARPTMSSTGGDRRTDPPRRSRAEDAALDQPPARPSSSAALAAARSGWRGAAVRALASRSSASS